MTFFDDKVICNLKKLVPKKPKTVTALWDRSNYSLLAIKDKFVDALGVWICRLQLQLGTGGRKEGRRGKKEGKESKKVSGFFEYRWIHAVPRSWVISLQHLWSFSETQWLWYSSQHVLL